MLLDVVLFVIDDDDDNYDDDNVVIITTCFKHVMKRKLGARFKSNNLKARDMG